MTLSAPGRTQQAETERQCADGAAGATVVREERIFTRDGLLCVLLLGGCLLAAWPVAEVGINDDWSYVRTAQLFTQTGHFIYNGWATAILGWQIVWGALFAHLFGSSFTAVRMSAIPIDLATALLYRAVLRRLGLNRGHATFGTLTLVLSPLFLPLGSTFMSDVPGLFAIFICVYLCQMAVDASTDRAVWGWLTAAALSNIALGTVRQTAWLGVLVVVPWCGWLLRRRRFVVPLTIGLWLTGLLGIQMTISWFLRQPYSVPETILRGHIDLLALGRLLTKGSLALLTVVLLCLPVLATGVRSLFPLRRGTAVRGTLPILSFVAAIIVLKPEHRTAALEPRWLGTTIDYVGIRESLTLLSPRSVPTAGMLVYLLFCLLCAWAFLETLGQRGVRDLQHRPQFRWREASLLLLPMLLSYCLLLVPRGMFLTFYDRYVLLIVAVVLVYALAWHQENVSARIPIFAILVLIVFGWVGVASTHDQFAMERARVKLIDELQRAGVQRTSIRGGFPFDGITQVDASGYVNEPALVNPPGAYHWRPIETGPCAYYFAPYVPAIHARYAVETEATSCAEPSSFAPVPYRTWLPPKIAYVWAGVLPGGDQELR